MTTETRQRIRAYKRMLPGLRERVIAVALLLAMSASMVGTASYAWLTISRRPEMSGASTTIAANGNLEIALATGEGKDPPKESEVGDSSAAENQKISVANTTWGNLINLSDPVYGLENLKLRPAQLNKDELLTSPLYAAYYTSDGRISDLTSDFQYTQWVPPAGAAPGYFGLASTVGVRGISSVKKEVTGEYAVVSALIDEAERLNRQANEAYIVLTQRTDLMPSLAYIMGIFMQSRMNATQADADHLINPTMDKGHIANLIKMYEEFNAVLSIQAQALAALLNLQLFLKNGGNASAYTEYTEQSLMQETAATLKAKGLTITDFDTFKTDYDNMRTGQQQLEEINAAGTVKWKDKLSADKKSSLMDIIGKLMKIESCTVQRTDVAGADIMNIGSIGATEAVSLNNKTCRAVITNGVLFNFEKRGGIRMNVGPEYNGGKGLKVQAKGKRYGIEMPGTIYALITTSASGAAQFTTDLRDSADMSDVEFEGSMQAQDTYGLAVDFWVRTNADASHLILEGDVRLSDPRSVDILGKDVNGNDVQLYTLTRASRNEETSEMEIFSIDLYKVETKTTDENNNEITETKWYDASSHKEFVLEEGDSPQKKVEEVYDIVGYEGVNRVWDTTTELPADATTQGSGSCYVYYADTPEDQAQSLDLLKAYNVAFVDADGRLLATAIMDTENHYAEAGRVTVPLMLQVTNETISLGSDTNGKAIYAITPLEKNKPTRITAIVYLDGSKLTNESVLSAAEIQGQLNIQFGNGSKLDPIEDEALQSQERRVTATVTPTSFDFDTADEMKSTVTVNVVGDQPENITAFFLREISPTQGSREPVMTEWTRNEDGAWVTEYTFTSPGNYILRSVQLDGVEYLLDTPERVEIEGFSLNYLRCNQADAANHIRVMTAQSSYRVDVELQFATTDTNKMPKKVQGKFVHEEGYSVNIDFIMDANKVWRGSATFLNSGDYVLENLVLDGNYMPLPANLQQTAKIYLGMQVAVYTESPTEFRLKEDEMTPEMHNLSMKVKIMDNSGDTLPGLAGAELRYSLNGSTVQGMKTTLTWDGSEYYVGSFPTERSGEFTFDRVSVIADGVTNVITSATTAPVFRISPPNPPDFHRYVPSDYQFVTAGDVATLSVEVANSDAARIYAVIRNTDKPNEEPEVVLGGKGTTYEAETNEGVLNVTPWMFTIPAEVGHRDGHWVIDELRIWDYYDEDNNWIGYKEGAENDVRNGVLTSGMQIRLDSSKTMKKVVETINVSFVPGQSKDLGRTIETVMENGQQVQKETRAPMLTTHTVSGLEVTIRDNWNEPIQGVHDIKLIYRYGENPENYGYYSSNAWEQTEEFVYVDFDDESVDSTGTYTQVADKTVSLTYAGVYTPDKLTFIVGTKDVTYGGTSDKPLPANNQPILSVYSAKPTVTISSVSPTNTIDVYSGTRGNDGTVDNDTYITGSYNTKLDDYNAVVYIHSGGNSGYTVSLPMVKLKLSGMVNSGFTASMSFANATSSANPAEYSFNSNNHEVEKGFGHGTSGSAGGILGIGRSSPKIFPAGNQTVDEITVSDGKISMTAQLSHPVTINQPQYPPSVKFEINNAAYPGPVPAQVYSATGDEYMITLPAASAITTTWSQDIETSKIENEVPVGDPVTTPVYETWTSGCDQKYQAYTKTVSQRVGDETITNYTETYTITGWKIGNEIYALGEEVTVSGSQTVTAVIASAESNHKITKYRTTTTETYYTAGANNLDEKPAGDEEVNGEYADTHNSSNPVVEVKREEVKG